MNKSTANKIFKEQVNGMTDKGAIRMEWALFVDNLCRDGIITQKQANEWQIPRGVV